jgi:hypothetical protein
MFYINYSTTKILEMFSKLRSSVKADEIAEFEQSLNHAIKVNTSKSMA